MLVSLSRRLVILATPKCASTSIEMALGAEMDVVIRGHPGAKHTNYRKFDRHLRTYLEGFGRGKLETLCLFREPTDWLRSWWRYRARPSIPDASKSTQAMTFDQFVRSYIAGDDGPANLGRQSRFVRDRDGGVGVDHIYRYDNLAACLAFLNDRLGTAVTLPTTNISPAAHSDDVLGVETSALLTQTLAEDFEIYRTIAK